MQSYFLTILSLLVSIGVNADVTRLASKNIVDDELHVVDSAFASNNSPYFQVKDMFNKASEPFSMEELAINISQGHPYMIKKSTCFFNHDVGSAISSTLIGFTKHFGDEVAKASKPILVSYGRGANVKIDMETSDHFFDLFDKKKIIYSDIEEAVTTNSVSIIYSRTATGRLIGGIPIKRQKYVIVNDKNYYLYSISQETGEGTGVFTEFAYCYARRTVDRWY